MQAIHEKIVANLGLPIKYFVFFGKPSDSVISKHWHKSVELLYCLKGQLEVKVDDRSIVLEASDILLLNSNTIHVTHSPVENEVLVFQIPYDFIIKETKGQYNSSYLFNLNTVENEDDYYEIRHTLNQLNKARSESPTDLVYKKTIVYYMLYLLMSKYSHLISRSRHIQTQKHMELLTDITEYMRSNFKHDLKLTTVAEAVGFSAPYISRFMKKHLKSTYTEFLNSLRLEYAYDLIVSSDMTITDIAYESGFPNVKSLNNLFRDIYKTTPLQYRKHKNDKN